MTLHLSSGFESPGSSAVDYGFDANFGSHVAPPNGFFSSAYWNQSELDFTLPTNDAHTFVGFAMYQPAVGDMVDLKDGSTVQLRFKSVASGGGFKVEVYRGAAVTLLGTSTTELSFSTWYFFELDVVFNATTGSVTMYLDGISDLALTSQNTLTSANAYITKVHFDSGAGSNRLDSFYICNDQGASHNARLGPQLHSYLTASAEGADTSGTANTGTKQGAVDDATTVDSDTTYVSLSGTGDRQGFTKAAMPDAGLGVPLVTNVWVGRRDDAGPTTARGFIRNSSGTYSYGSTRTLSGSYVTYRDQFPLSPFTGLAWTQTEVDGLQFGVEKVS